MEHCKEPHPYPQRIMILQKDHETLKKSNQNKNLEEAQEIKKGRASIVSKEKGE